MEGPLFRATPGGEDPVGRSPQKERVNLRAIHLQQVGIDVHSVHPDSLRPELHLQLPCHRSSRNIAFGSSPHSPEGDHGLHVSRLGEEVEGADPLYLVGFTQSLEVPGQRGRVATHVDDSLRAQAHQRGRDRVGKARSGRVEDDQVCWEKGAQLFLYQPSHDPEIITGMALGCQDPCRIDVDPDYGPSFAGQGPAQGTHPAIGIDDSFSTRRPRPHPERIRARPPRRFG